MAITILDVLYAEAPELRGAESLNMGEFDKRGLPFFAGCQRCGAQLAPYNAFPSKTGYIQCKDDIEDVGFETVEEFKTFADRRDEEANDD